MSRLRDHLLRSADPFLLGYSRPEYLLLGYLITGGLCFPLREGGSVLQRRRLYPVPTDWQFCGLAKAGAATIAKWPGFGHEPNMAFQYRTANVLGSGYVGDFSEPIRVDFDAAGAPLGPLPMYPKNVVARGLSQGRFEITFEYDPYGHGKWPKDFQVFEGASAGAINYSRPLINGYDDQSSVPQIGRQRAFTFLTEGYSDRSEHCFAVRARDPNGVAERNMFTTPVAIARNTAASITAIDQVIQRVR